MVSLQSSSSDAREASRARVSVITLLPLALQTRIEACLGPKYEMLHAGTPERAIATLKAHSPRALLFSPSERLLGPFAHVRSILRLAGAALPIAVVCEDTQSEYGKFLELGSAGVAHTVDLRSPTGHDDLRKLVGQAEGDIPAILLPRISGEVGRMKPGMIRLFDELARKTPQAGTVRSIAVALGIPATSLVSRFIRAGLPSPKRYLVGVRFIYLSHALQAPGATLASAAYKLGFASPQSLGRHVRSELGITGTEYRMRYTMDEAIEQFITSLIQPYTATLRHVDPLTSKMPDRVPAFHEARRSRLARR